MKKRVFGYKLSRDKNERKALFRLLVSALLEKGEIQTTLIKAKAIQSQAERLVTRAKKDSVANRRVVHRFLTKTDLVNRLFTVIAPAFKDKNGGYTRIIKTGFRQGDRAATAKISFTEEFLKIEKPVKEKPIKETKPTKKAEPEKKPKTKIKKQNDKTN